MTLRELVKKYRIEHALSLRDFAKRCNMSHSYIAMLEDGKNSKTGQPMVPTLPTLRKIAHAMGMITNDLIDAADDLTYEIDNKKTPLTDQERELHFLMTYDRMEIAALESVSQIIKWDNGGRTETFPFAKEEAEQIVTDLLEVLFWRCGGMRELFFSNPEYRQERMRRGNSPDMMTLDIADKIAELIKEVC